MNNIIKYTDFLSYYLYQPLAFFILRFIKKSNITPNQITLVSLIFGILAAICLYLNLKILSFFMLQISFILDCLDGQLARLKSLSSKLGMWLDNLSDRIVENSMILTFILINNNFCVWGALLIFLNMFYSYMSDLEIYVGNKYRKLSTFEKVMFSPIYLLNRSFVILILSIAIFYFKIIFLLEFLYFYGIIFKIYRKIYGEIR